MRDASAGILRSESSDNSQAGEAVVSRESHFKVQQLSVTNLENVSEPVNLTYSSSSSTVMNRSLPCSNSQQGQVTAFSHLSLSEKYWTKGKPKKVFLG